jgi:hypothetical protein
MQNKLSPKPLLSVAVTAIVLAAMACESNVVPQRNNSVAAPQKPSVLTPKQREAQQAEASNSRLRARTCTILEDTLVKGGFDVRVGVTSDNNRHMMIVGPDVTRVFAHQLMKQNFRQKLLKFGFKEVTFMKSEFSGWVASFDLTSNTYRD